MSDFEKKDIQIGKDMTFNSQYNEAKRIKKKLQAKQGQQSKANYERMRITLDEILAYLMKQPHSSELQKIIYMLPDGRYWSYFFLSPLDQKGHSGIITFEELCRLEEEGVVNAEQWTVSRHITQKRDREKVKYYQQLRLEQLKREKEKQK